jgi:hypothetical protein
VPGVLHQGVLSLFKDDPCLALASLGLECPVVGPPLDRSNELDIDAKQPWQVNPIYPDLVLVLRDPDHPDRDIVLCIEIQRKSDPKKRYRLVGYHGMLVSKYQRRVLVVVVSYSRAFSRLVRSWAHSDPKIAALVLDADCVPLMTLEQARARPTAAVLAATLHGARGNIEMARIAIAAIQSLPEHQQASYTATILAALPLRQRNVLLEELPVTQRNELWEIEKRSGTYRLGLSTGRKEGRKEGRDEARQIVADLILTMLEDRAVEVDPASAARIRAEKVLPRLRRWAIAARNVTRVAELLKIR